MAGLEAKLRISAQDDAGPAFAALKKQISGLDSQIANFDKLMAAAGKTGKFADPLIASIAASQKALEGQRGAVVSLGESLRGLSGGADAAAEGQHMLGAATEATTRIMIAQGVEATRIAGKIVTAQEQAVRGARRTREKGGLGKTAGVIGGSVGGIAGLIIGGEIIHATIDAAKSGADLEAMKFNIREASKGDASESPFAESLAGEIAAKYPNITEAEALRTYVEMRNNSLNQDGTLNQGKMRRNLMAASKGQTAALALGIPMEPNEMQDLIKVVEGTGRADDPGAIEKIIDLYTKGKQQLGSALTADKMRDFVQNAKAANFSMSDAELIHNMVRSTEGNASRLGTEMASTMATLVGGHMLKQTGQWLVSMGLAKGFIEHGPEKGKIYGLKDRGLAEVSQLGWANETLLPALVKHYVVSDKAVAAQMNLLRTSDLKADPNAKFDERVLRERAEMGLISAEIMKSGVKSTVADNLAHAIANEHLIERDSAGMLKMSGSDAAKRIGENPVAAFAEFTHSIENFGAVVVSPAMKAVAPILDEMSHAMANMSATVTAWRKDHPDLSSVADKGVATIATVGGGVVAASLLARAAQFVWRPLAALFGGGAGAGAAGAGAAGAGEVVAAAEGGAILGGPVGAAVGAAAGLAAGAGLFAWLNSPSGDKAKAGAPTGAIINVGQRAAWPNQIQDMELSRRAQQEFRRDPEAAHARAMHDLGIRQSQSTVVGVAGSAQVDQNLHIDISLDPDLRADLDRLKQLNFSVPLAPVGRMDSDAAPSHSGGIGRM